jgi:hypothetical protein
MKTEFDRQLHNLLQKGYPEAAGMLEEQFINTIGRLREKAAGLTAPEADPDKGELPFVIVIKSSMVSTEKAMALVNREGKNGVISMAPAAPADFKTPGSVKIPDGPAYLLADIDRGKETLNIRPVHALEIIKKNNRSPLNIDEGMAVITQYPDFLKKNNCFSLLASRRNDKRVPAIWISESRPKLGWCWDGNPHTWLGSASAGGRVGA